MSQEEKDKQMHECMSIIWSTYRSGDTKAFNTLFAELYAKYTDKTVQQFIKGMGWGLSVAVNERNGACTKEN